MKEKLTLQDIVDLLAKRTSLNKKEADAFFREFFALIVDNAFNNDPVKIKDFGTFKLTKVSSRESVDVNTGAKIEIPAHYKLSFLPDKSLKELVNKPFAHFETTLLEEGVSFDLIEESEEEPVGLQEEEDTSVEEDVAVKENVVEKSDSPDEDKKTEGEPTGEKDKVEEKVESLGDEDLGEKSTTAPISFGSSTYTYVLNYDVTESGSISISIPASALASQGIILKETKREEKEDVPAKETLGEETETTQEPDVEKDGEEAPPIEVNKVQEKIDQLKEAIEALTKSEPEDEEAEEIPLDIEIPISSIIDETSPSKLEVGEDESETETASEVEEEKVIIIEEQIDTDTEADAGMDIPAAEEPVEVEAKQEPEKLESVVLDDAVNISYSAFKDVDDEHIESMVEEKDGIDETIDEVDSDEDFEDDYQYTDYYKETSFSRVRRKIPIIIILLLIIGIGIYMFYNLFNNNINQSFPSYKGHGGYIAADSLANDSAEIADEQPSETDLVVPAVMPEDSSQIVSDNTEQSPDSISGLLPKQYEKIISGNLKIGVVNKAAYMQDAKGEVQNGTARITTGSGASRIATETVEQGSTFRTIATKYYGNGAFWVYIYEENKDKIPDYNALPVGAVLAIPALEKYGTSVNDPRAVEKAKEMELSVYNSRSIRR